MVAKQSMLLFTPLLTLLHREMRRLARHPVRIWCFLLTPLLLALAVSSGVGQGILIPGLSDGVDMEHYIFASLVVLSGIMTAINAPVTVLEDRREGFLQAVLVAPISYSSLVFAKVLSATLMALIQSGLLLAAAPLLGTPLSPSSLLVSLVIMGVVGVGFAALGFIIAWLSDSAASFHAVTGMLLVPLWILGNGIAPLPADSWLKQTEMGNPVAFAIATVRRGVESTASLNISDLIATPALFSCIIFALVITLFCYLLLKMRIRTVS